MGKLNWGNRVCAALLLCATAAVALPAQTFTTLVSFDNTNGSTPLAPLIQATDGNLYGTTIFGGTILAGTAFKISPDGTLTTVYNFCSQSGCVDGGDPKAALVQPTGGTFYGTAGYGGASGVYGTVFKMTPSGKVTTMHSFDSTDGADPASAVIQATDGNFYGTTYYGGASDSCSKGCGTVFRITPQGTLTTLHSFSNTDGSNPNGLIQDTNGSLYGTTVGGGAHNWGTVFKISLTGNFTTLYNFCSQGGASCTDGISPSAGLIQGSDGNLYGTTLGTVFRITPSGKLTTLYTFCSLSNCVDGNAPYAPLIQASDGNFYGTTGYGGANGDGTIFEITPAGTLTTLYSFCSQSNCADGRSPVAALVQDTNGTFYGTSYLGGTSNDGTVFSLAVGLAPFVETLPSRGKVGENVEILGTNLTGSTSVTFNGTPAAFTVESGSYIKTTVPAGASTGKVEVVTPSGTLSSNVPFRVAP